MNQTNHIGTVLALHWHLICLSQVDNPLAFDLFISDRQSNGSKLVLELALEINWII